MSPTTGTIRHPEVSEISDLTEGLLTPSRGAEVRRHLGECSLCADVLASLQEIRDLLGTLPGPPRMPAAIAGRIDAALAAEALLDSTGSRTASTDPAPPPGRAGADLDADAGVSRETPAAETQGGGTPTAVSRETPAAGPGRSAPRPSGRPSGSTGPGRRRARRRIAVLTGLAGAAACVLAVFLVNGLTGSTSDEPATAARSDASSTAGRTPGAGYTAQGLQDSVRRLLATGSTGETGETAKTGDAVPSPPDKTNKTMGLENTPGLAPSDRRGAAQANPVPPCVQQSTGRADPPLAADRGTYEGEAVFLVVLPHPGDPALVDAYVVPATCADTPAQAPGTPLLTRTYPRG
ncbi:anti-sigma factor family protein [Streptomyces sp. NPDC054854]